MFNLKALQRSKTLKYGVPMLLLVVGGSFGLREFTQIRYDAQRIRKKLDPSLEARVNVQNQALVLEEEYEGKQRRKQQAGCSLIERPPTWVCVTVEKMKEKDLDSWKNIRGPRPWEDSRQYQDQQRSRQNNE